MTDPVSRLLDDLQRSGLLATNELERITADLLQEQPPTAEDAAASLVQRRSLTPYQAEELLAGRGAGCVIAGRYHLLDKLGEGGMGAVYRARDTQLDRDVAIKVLPDRSLADPDAVARFRREARALAKVSHPNIVHAHDAGEDGGRHFLVMEHVEGVSLARVLQERGRITPGLAAEYVRQAALGLQHAHEKGLVHRDLKPGNLLLGRNGTVKVLDLGLARFLQDQIGDPGLTREGSGMGTPDYMAPEQFRDAHHADPRADIYALGCTLYHLLAGRVPFPGSSLSEKARAHAEEAPPDFATACPEAPAGLALAVLKMMAKRPAARFQSAAEVAEALTPFVASSSGVLPDLKTTATWQRGQLTLTDLPRGRRLLRRVGVAVAVVGLMLASAIFGSWLLDRGEQVPEDRTAQGPPTEKAPAPAEKKEPKKGKEVSKKPEPPRPQVVTIPNGLTVAQDGTGQFKTINEALEKIKPGQTIRILDAATYREPFRLSGPDHAGITLESPNRALLAPQVQDTNPVEILNAPGVTLRGFRLRGEGKPKSLMFVKGLCPGVTVEDLELSAGPGTGWVGGVEIIMADPPPDALPVRVQRCTMKGIGAGVLVLACEWPARYDRAQPSGRVIIAENQLSDGHFGVIVCGAGRQICVVGNRLVSLQVGLQLENLLPGAGDILIANNTALECEQAFRYWDGQARGKGIRVSNNLVLAPRRLDMEFCDSGGNRTKLRGPGDVEKLGEIWQWGHNWREVSLPAGKTPEKGWIPGWKSDVIVEKIDGVNRARGARDFLRPAKDSPLATGGAGGDLPGYVGALPPPGAEPWDWERTWKARFEKPAGEGKGGK